MRKSDRVLRLAFVSAFALFLLVALIFTYRARGRSYSFFENRSLAARPALAAEDVLDGTYFSRLESYLIDHAAGHNALTRLDTRLDLLLRRPVVNDVVVRDDILLPWLGFETVDPARIADDAAQMAENLRSVDELVSSYGGRYCYVAVPCQYAYHSADYPAYLNNRDEYTKLSLAALSRELGNAGVDFLDMGAVFDALGHPGEFSSAVDNHYSIFGAYETYRAILERFGLPALAPDDFDRAEVETPYLGSRTRKLLGTWPSDERLFVLTPKDPVPFSRADDGHEAESAVYAPPAAGDEWVTYSFYMGGDVGSTVIDTGRDGLPSLLIYGDSFTNAVECLIYLSFDQTHSLDFRYYGGGLTLGEYIEAYRPDYVVCVRDYEALLLSSGNGAGAY